MKFYAARQAIFNRRLNVVAYELFYRSSSENQFPFDTDSHRATSRLVTRTHLGNGLMSYTGGKPALINFSETCLLQKIPQTIPKGQIMVEVLETVSPSEEVFQELRELYRKGYNIAFDDFVYQPVWNRFLSMARLIKFDIRKTPLDTLIALIPTLKKKFPKAKIVAEKVEKKEEFEQAKEMGFNFFQGYFFCQPEMFEGHQSPDKQAILIAIFNEVLKFHFNPKKVAELLKRDPSLTFKLLRFINSGVFPLKKSITSVRQALIYLGGEETRKFILLLVTAEEAGDKPKEIVNLAILRAKFCELIAGSNKRSLAEHGFLVGLFSMMDVILSRPMQEIMDEVPLDDQIKDVLLGLASAENTPLGLVLNIAKHYEQGCWNVTTLEAQKLNIVYEDLSDHYREALRVIDHYNDSTTRQEA